MGDRERHDPLLDHLRQRVGHLRPPALPGPEHLKAMPVDLMLPGVVGGARCTPNVRHAAETFVLAASAKSCWR